MMSKIAEYKLTTIPGARAVFARGIRHNFSRHAHESHIIGAVVQGCRFLETGGRVQQIASGELFCLRPFQEHVCSSGWEGEHDYIALALNTQQFAEVWDIAGSLVPLAFTELFELIGREKFGRGMVSAVMLNLARLVRDLLFWKDTCNMPRQIVRGLDFIGQNYMLRLSLGDIAEYCCMSKYNFQREFTRYVGMSPAAVISKKRVYSALHRIYRGEAASRVALECGFADQSHLCRTVKKLTGVTVSNYQLAAEDATLL